MLIKRGFISALLLVGLCTSGMARVSWYTPGEYRLYTYLTDGFSLSDEQRMSEQNWGRHRLRLKPSMEVGSVSVLMELDVLSGQIFGTTHTVGERFEERRHVELGNSYDGWTTLEPRQIWVEIKGPFLTIRLGQMKSAWGLGLLSDEMDWRRPSFVQSLREKWNGDLVDQLEVDVRPFARSRSDGWSGFRLSLAVGSTFQDEHAALLDGGDAYNFAMSMLVPLDAVTGGVRVQRKVATKSSGEVVDYTTVQSFARWVQPILRLGSTLFLEGEFVYQKAAVQETADLEALDEMIFESYGVVAALEYVVNCPQVGVRLEGGVSSGDGGTKGESVMHFDPDFAPSVLALPIVERWLSARYAEQLVSLYGDLPTGDSLIPSDGSLRSMGYLRLASTWRYGRLESTLASTWLWRTGDLQTAIDGEETLSMGRRGFVGSEVAGLAMVDIDRNGGFRLGARWASFFSQQVSNLAPVISQTSVQSEWRW